LRRLQTRPRVLQLAGWSFGAPIALSVAVLAALSVGFWIPGVQRQQEAAMTPTAGFAKGCFQQKPQPRRSPAECTWNPAAAGRPIYLLGDSNADQFSDALIGAGTQLGRPVVSYTRSSCPFFDVFVRNPLIPDATDAVNAMRACRRYYDDTLAWVRQQRPGTVVVGASDYYWTLPGVLIGASQDDLKSDTATTSELLAGGLRQTIGALEAAGHDVVVTLTVPMFYYPYIWPARQCTIRMIVEGRCEATMPLSAANARQKRAHDGMRLAVADTHARVLELADVLCPGGTCGASRDILWSLDGYHISVPTAKRLTPVFAAAVAR
jgi:hypothetical protein